MYGFVRRVVAQVRIARIADDPNLSGYWSYVGTDILTIPMNQPTMNLEAFTMQTPDAEFVRVIRHEAGHTIGCEHEHVRRAVVDRIDREKAYAYFQATQGWSRPEVDGQVLRPVEESALIGTPKSDETSIMCYQLPGEIMKNGQPVLGGVDINGTDGGFIAKVYPKPKGSGKSKKAKKRKKTQKRVKKARRGR